MRSGTCERCGTGFTDRSPSQNRKFCSDHCRRVTFTSKPESRIPCRVCGAPTAHTPGQSVKSSRGEEERECRSCWHEGEGHRTTERGHEIERWWAEGLTYREIGERLGWSIGHVNQEVIRLRLKGFDLPRRPRGGLRVAA